MNITPVVKVRQGANVRTFNDAGYQWAGTGHDLTITTAEGEVLRYNGDFLTSVHIGRKSATFVLA